MKAAGRFRWMALAILLCVVGCSSNKGKIEGTKWTSTAATIKGQSIPAGALVLEFRGDGGLTYKAGLLTFTGTYSLGSGNSVTLKLNQELAGRKNHTESIEITGDSLVMTDTDGTQVKFVRAK